MFYEQLKEACKNKKTSVTAVLKAINIGTANGTYWKNGSIPSSDIVVKLAEYLDVTTDYLLTGKESTSSLDEEDQECLDLFRSLSDKDKGKIIGRMETMIESYSPEVKEVI